MRINKIVLHYLHIWLLIVILFSLSKMPALASQTAKKPKYMQIPILYLTDRQRQKQTFGSDRRYIINCQHNMYYGVAYFSVANNKIDVGEKVEEQLGWKPTNKKPGGISPKEFIDDNDPPKAKIEFFKRVAQALDRSGSDKLCIFVHGAEDSFEDSSTDAAQLAYCLEQPVIIYSWPSVPKLLGYVIDNGNNEWSQAHFDMFMHDLQSFKEKHPVQISLVSHSMGNRLVIRAAPIMSADKLIKDFELISPDIDLGVCQHYMLDLTDPTANIRLYFSRKDKMLALSQMLFGGYYRLGQGMGEFISKQSISSKTPADRNIDHSQVVTQPAGAPDNDIERIDFTAIDQGFRGHSIPFQLIADMINGNKPEHGLKFLDVDSEESAKIVSGIMSWHLDKVDPTQIGPCKRVVVKKPHISL